MHHYAARQAALEGTVVLDLVVGKDGMVRSIDVVHGLDHGLTEAAITAAKLCRFTPGERDGIPVPVRIRGFKIRFFLQGGAD
jgi:TonB family protein